MTLENVLAGLDNLFDEHKIDEISPYLERHIKEAIDQGEDGIVLSLLNELIGFLRDVSRFDECVAYCQQILKLIDQMGLKGSYPYATSMLNVANAYRAAGKLEESRNLYNQVVESYKELMDETDYRFAPLYNNMSLLEQECKDFGTAVIYLKKALDIVSNIPERRVETAITHTNLAVSLLKIKKLSEAMANLKSAFEIFEDVYKQTGQHDFHYMAALSAMAEALYMSGDAEGAASYYRFALQEIEKNTGKSAAYEITLQNLKQVESELGLVEQEEYIHYSDGKESDKDASESYSKSAIGDSDVTDSKGSNIKNYDRAGLVDESEQVKGEHSPSVIYTGLSGLELSERFYHEFGAPMIAEKFSEYEADIAVGLVGEGSECLGYDDEVSRDHDFGPGFCLWITDAIYEKIGARLQEEYDKLPKTYMGLTRKDTPKAGKRIGVFSIGEFYEKYIGSRDVPATENQWLFLEDYQLKNVTNGKVFRDDLGEFTRIRKELLKGYPENVRIKKIARQAALIAQSGQYNFGRMLGRGDTVAAQIALAEFSRNTMKMVYLLNRVYAPFYKWLRRGLDDLACLSGIGVLLDAISSMVIHDERITGIIEKIVEYIIAEMKKQSLTSSDETFLDAHTNYILKALPDHQSDNIYAGENSSSSKNMDSRPIKDQLIEELIKLEWNAFDKTENEGGRASCQNDFGTFNVMRKSQYLQWEIPMLASFIEDFKVANSKGRNLITEKYGRMMASTALDRYEEIKDNFPELDEDRLAIQEAIIGLQVGMMEECAKKYPKSATNARSIHTYEDNPYNTSYETYLRGELGTYSEKTLELYGRFMAKTAQEGRNLAMEIIENTAKMYGYESLDDLEAKL